MILECSNCSAIVNAEPLANYDGSNEESGMHYVFTFLKCPQCKSPMLAQEEYTGLGIDDELVMPERLYPPREREVSLETPTSIATAFKEATACFRGKAYTASAIMCRKTLEGICAHYGVGRRGLHHGLNEMREKGIIESTLFEWADALRIAGNEAVHDIDVVVSASDARDILDFTIALTDYIFTFRQKFELFKSRREKEK